jgi:predicted nucleic acid-binding protein
MKPMKDNVFIDTNVLVYSYSFTEPSKQSIAQNLVFTGNAFISTQVLQELSNILNKKFKIDWHQITNVLAECQQNFNVYLNLPSTVSQACLIADKYKYSFYDSLIIAAALQTNCTTLYSEDLQHGQLIDETLKIFNPFK